MIQLPNIMRPRGVPYRKLSLGLDLPAWFYHNIKAIDEKIHFVYHPYRVLWDDVMNVYSGSLSDPRNNIHPEFGWENWGYVLTDGDGAPIREDAWHLWRLAEPFGWTHIVKIDSKEPVYLDLLTERLFLQATIKAKGAKAWRDKQLQDEQDAQDKAYKDKQEQFSGIQEENSWLVRKAMENLDRGVTKPTRPTKEIITSYTGQGNRSKIVRPLTDKEGGLIIPGE